MLQSLAPREHFPILSQSNYLASHSLGAMPLATRAELDHYANLWQTQGILAWEGEWWEALEDFSQRLTRIFQAPAPNFVPCLNVTLGFAAVASCLDYRGERRRIVFCDREFTTTAPFWQAQARYGAECLELTSPDGNSMPIELLEEAIDERTLLVVSSHAYFRSGALQDIERLQRHCQAMGALLLVDAYQSAGCVPLNLSQCPLDFLVGGCHKWLCGGPGGGYLYIRPGLLEQLQPSLRGWFGLAEPFAYGKSQDYAPDSRRFLNGTPNVLGLFAARQGLKWIEDLGIEAIRHHSLQMTDWLLQQLQQRDLPSRTPSSQGSRGGSMSPPRTPPQRNGMVCVDFPQAQACQAYLQRQQIVVDYRADCGIRISPHFYSQLSDLEALVAALDDFFREI